MRCSQDESQLRHLTQPRHIPSKAEQMRCPDCIQLWLIEGPPQHDQHDQSLGKKPLDKNLTVPPTRGSKGSHNTRNKWVRP